jgi:hypothetical protein
LFKDRADWAHSATKVVFGVKLHLVINDRKKVANFYITKGSASDISALDELLKPLKGTVIGDKGYVSMKAHEKLKAMGIFMVAKARKT